MADFFKINYTDEEKIEMVMKAITLREKYGLTLEVIRTRLGLKQATHLSKLLRQYGDIARQRLARQKEEGGK